MRGCDHGVCASECVRACVLTATVRGVHAWCSCVCCRSITSREPSCFMCSPTRASATPSASCRGWCCKTHTCKRAPRSPRSRDRCAMVGIDEPHHHAPQHFAPYIAHRSHVHASRRTCRAMLRHDAFAGRYPPPSSPAVATPLAGSRSPVSRGRTPPPLTDRPFSLVVLAARATQPPDGAPLHWPTAHQSEVPPRLLELPTLHAKRGCSGRARGDGRRVETRIRSRSVRDVRELHELSFQIQYTVGRWTHVRPARQRHLRQRRRSGVIVSQHARSPVPSPEPLQSHAALQSLQRRGNPFIGWG
jgi:hypothetical protein